jgi:hypothetical protein
VAGTGVLRHDTATSHSRTRCSCADGTSPWAADPMVKVPKATGCHQNKRRGQLEHEKAGQKYRSSWTKSSSVGTVKPIDVAQHELDCTYNEV